MKSVELQKLAVHLAQEGKSLREISSHLRGQVSKSTLQIWISRFHKHGKLILNSPTGRKRTTRTKKLINNVKMLLKQKNAKKSTREISKKLKVHRSSIQRVLKKDLQLKPYRERSIPYLTALHKEKRITFVNWVRKNIRKDDSRKILFSDEKKFTINGVYNSQNTRIWAPTRSEADLQQIHQKRKFPSSLMVWM
jgi:transposase